MLLAKWNKILLPRRALQSTGLVSSDVVMCEKLGRSIYRQWTSLQAGFPVRISSTAGRGIGIGVPVPGLWTEFARIVSELRPSCPCGNHASLRSGVGSMDG